MKSSLKEDSKILRG